MTEEFETAAAAICTGTWWNSSKNMFSGCSLACSGEMGPDIGILGWQHFDALEVREMLSCPESENNCNPVNSSTASLPDINLDSTSQIMGLGLSSPPDWNQSIFAHAEGDDERKLDSKNFFEGLLELTRSYNNSPDEQFSSSCPRTAPILDSPVANLKPQQLGCSPCSDNLCLNESVVLSLLRDIKANFEDEPQACKSLTSKAMNEKAEESDGNDDDDSPRLKRQRIETPSPLPSFKVRKEKLGDRITALQQLVSPFGKTDTASVLHEAIEYIKFLHEQVTALSNPYTKSVAPVQQQQDSDKSSRNQECQQRQDLRSRGLCLAPISSTFPIAAQMNTSDFWTFPFGINLR